MGKRWPALDVVAAGEAQTDRAQLLADDFSPTAIEETPAGLRIFFTTTAGRDRAAHSLGSQFQVSSIDVPDEDWARRSQAGLGPITVGRITILPARPDQPDLPGQPDPPDPSPARPAPPALPALVIPPSMGFGTGHHATTRLCLAALQQADLSGRTVLDVGTGSGVLAIAAVLLGAARALGIDDDPDAVQAAMDNLALNPHVPGERIQFAVGDLMTMGTPAADVVTANLTGGLLIRAAGRLRAAVKPGGLLIMSGLETAERDDVWRAFGGFELVAEASEAGWSTVTARDRSKVTGV